MATFVTGTASTALTILATEDLVLVSGASRYVDFDSAIAETGGGFTTRMRIDGTVVSLGFDAIKFETDSIFSDLMVVGSSGQVHSIGGVGVRMNGAGARFINDGDVSGDTGAVMGFGIFSTVENRGTLSGNAVDGAGLSCESGQSFVQINNSGTISGYNGIRVDDCFADIMNSGTIRATDGNGAALDFALAFSSCDVRNFGTIEAPVTALRDGQSDDLVVNGGRIVGDVVFSGGSDTFRGKSGVLEGGLYGGTGSDRLFSGIGDDTVQGGDGNDILRGNDGEDQLFGGRGNDQMRGDAGDDTLTGGSGSDAFIFTRGAGSDRIGDFTNGLDQIDVSAFALASFAALSTLAADRSAGLLIDLRSLGGGTVLVEGFLKAQLDAGDVIL
jgi:Ca2+-binding RTX toxin-like protein